MPALENFCILILICILSLSILHRLKTESVIGYMIAGIIIGPFGFNLIKDTSSIEFLGELGIIIMVFYIGLELPIKRLKALRVFIFGIGGLQFLLITPILSSLTYIFLHLSFINSAIIGAAFSLSSTALILNILQSKSELSSKFGRITFSSLLFQDLSVVPMIILCNFIKPEFNGLDALKGVSIKILLALFLLVIIGMFLIKPIFYIAARKKQKEMFLLITLFIISLLSIITLKSGLSVELGAFLAGFIMSETKYRHQIEAEINPFRGLLLGMFFVNVGMSLNIFMFLKHIEIIIIIFIVVFIVKFAINYFVNFLFNINHINSLRSALLLTGSGEFVFVLIKNPNIQLSDVYTNIIFCFIILSMMVTPFIDKIFIYLNNLQVKTTKPVQIHSNEKIVIIGFDNIGQLTAKALEIYQIPYVVIDNKINKIEGWKESDISIIYLNTQKEGVIKNLDLSNIKLFIVNVARESNSRNIIMEIHNKHPNKMILARCLNENHKKFLKKLNITHLPVESVTIANSMINKMLTMINKEEIKSSKIIQYLESMTIDECKNIGNNDK